MQLLIFRRGGPGLQGAFLEWNQGGGGWNLASGLNNTGYLAKIERQTNRNIGGPRLGLAYRVTDSWMVRSGFGVTYTPSNTGHFGGPCHFRAQNFAGRTNQPVAGQYGASPQGALVAPYSAVTQMIPAIGSNRNAPQCPGIFPEG